MTISPEPNPAAEAVLDADYATKIAAFRVSRKGMFSQGVCFTVAPVCAVLTAAAVPMWVRLAAACISAGTGGFLAFMNQSVSRRHASEAINPGAAGGTTQ